MFSIRALALDVDYKSAQSFNTKLKPLAVFEGVIEPMISEYMIPAPNYIEYGHQLRLIYLLREPINLKNNANMKNTAYTVLSRLADKMNNEFDLNVEPQKINSYFRFPGSINSKDGSTVHVIPYSTEKLTIQEIINDYLPPLPKWYDDWKKKKTLASKSKSGVTKPNNLFKLWTDRKALFLSLRSREGIPREKLVHLYAQSLLWLNEVSNTEELIRKLLEFNDGFPSPLLTKEIRSKFRTEFNRKYQYSNNRIRDELGLSEKEIPMTNKEACRIRMGGKTRKQIAEAHFEQAKKLYFEGKTRKEMMAELGLSEAQIKRYRKRIREELNSASEVEHS